MPERDVHDDGARVIFDFLGDHFEQRTDLDVAM
jgi:hypothetical protein